MYRWYVLLIGLQSFWNVPFEKKTKKSLNGGKKENLYKEVFCLQMIVDFFDSERSPSMWRTRVKRGLGEILSGDWPRPTRPSLRRTSAHQPVYVRPCCASLSSRPGVCSRWGGGGRTPVPTMWPSILFLPSLGFLGGKLFLRLLQYLSW